ncbi:cytochrome c oxidase assembly factor 3, mitochondrial [[Candida] jaroonii]|uniref:Cytochrome c oxidase assembly factor 3, mitochondrial n=1 Tax=[Candida] jaroonii TaxID=467808 RepID=A0ACA9Y3V7_9ASCO|nr:cytochrome c oxidase assembly factor 3, mitochondrial [[Candida] jaroonii]
MPVVGIPKSHSKYRNQKTFEITPALYRVRSQYFNRNLIGFFAVTAIPLGVYLYTWKMLTTDDLSDIPIPPISDEELSKLKKEYSSKK